MKPPAVVVIAALTWLPLTLFSAEFKIGVHLFTVPDGFTVERVAGPGIVDRPIVADFDEQGRLYVAESSGSNDPVDKQLKEKPHRILRLEDTNADGLFDKSIVYADKMMFPEGTMWLNGSLYVSAPPVIWKLTDTDNDGVADKREEWLDAKTLTGCANDLHGPYLGLDGWIYWCKGAFAKQSYDRPEAVAFETRAAHIFRRRPEGGVVEAVMTGGMDNPVDVTFTAEGERIFTTTFFQHPGGGQRDGLVHAIYGGVYGKVHDVIDDHKKTGDLMPVLTHLGPAAPSGLTRYESEVFGSSYRDNLFAALFNLHKVTRHILKPKGATYVTEDSDFLISDQTDFHPTDVIEDADGSLLVIDTGGWYKLCCPTSQLWKPDVLGAIYRLRRTDAPRVEDPRGRKIDFKGADVEALAALLKDPRPAVTRRAIKELRTRNTSASFLEGLLRAGAPERQQLNVVWALAENADPEARNALVAAMNADRPLSVRHAAVHATSVAVSGTNLLSLIALLEAASPPSLQRVAAEALGRTKNPDAIRSLISAAAALEPGTNGLPDRIQEHSIIYALIEINSPDRIRAESKSLNALSPLHPFARRAALIALDQISPGALKPEEVVPLLTSTDAALKETASWIIAHRKEWGVELAAYFENRLRETNLSESEWKEITTQLVKLVESEAIRQLIGQLVADTKRVDRVRKEMFSVMSRANVKVAPQFWVESITALLKSGHVEPEMISAASSFQFKEMPAELRSELDAVARNSKLPVSTRLQALSNRGANTPLDRSFFELAQSQLATAAAPDDRRLALAILGKSALTEEQLMALATSVETVSPLEISSLLSAFEKGSSEKVGERLLAAIKSAAALPALTSDHIYRAFEKFPKTIKEQAVNFAASLNSDHTEQSARIEELLPKVKNGDIRRGQAIFNSQAAACSACHAIGYLGGDLGPDLTRIGQVRTERDLLEAILYPSASFVRSYEPVIVETRDGDQFSGILRKDAPDEVILGTGPGAEIRLARADIVTSRPGKLSVMPQGLDEQLSREQLADLIAFLKATRW